MDTRCELIRDVIVRTKLTSLLGILDRICEDAKKYDVLVKEEDVRDFLAAYLVVNFIMHPSLANKIASNRLRMIMWRDKLIFKDKNYAPDPFLAVNLDVETYLKLDVLGKKLNINEKGRIIKIAVDKLYNEIIMGKNKM